jgi:hypothetical protein
MRAWGAIGPVVLLGTGCLIFSRGATMKKYAGDVPLQVVSTAKVCDVRIFPAQDPGARSDNWVMEKGTRFEYKLAPGHYRLRALTCSDNETNPPGSLVQIEAVDVTSAHEVLLLGPGDAAPPETGARRTVAYFEQTMMPATGGGGGDPIPPGEPEPDPVAPAAEPAQTSAPEDINDCEGKIKSGLACWRDSDCCTGDCSSAVDGESGWCEEK